MKENEYIISESELVDLLATYFRLEALEQGGVDNWEWYGESFSDWKEQYGSFEECAKSDLKYYRKTSKQ